MQLHARFAVSSSRLTAYYEQTSGTRNSRILLMWLRRVDCDSVYPDLLSTMLVPKAE